MYMYIYKLVVMMGLLHPARFADFVAQEVQKRTGSASLRLRLALKMVYLEAVQKARRHGMAPKMSSSPVTSSAPSEVGEESEHEED